MALLLGSAALAQSVGPGRADQSLPPPGLALLHPSPPRAGGREPSLETSRPPVIRSKRSQTGVQGVVRTAATENVTLGAYRLPAASPAEKRRLTLDSGAGRVQLTRTQLMSLPSSTLVTRHAQLGRTFTYQGVLLRTVAAAMNITGKDIRVYASNGFVSTITAEDYLKAPIMLAYAANGKPISIVEKGPLTIVLPANDPDFQHKAAYWVWFVERLTPAP